MVFDPLYFVFLAPAMFLAMWAQGRVKSAYSQGMQVPTPISGAAAAQHILSTAGVHDVAIEQVQGKLSDHYDPSHRVLRLSSEVYGTRSATAVGIAAHEAGHALQHATHYAPLVIRNAAVPLASLGSQGAFLMLMLGFTINPKLLWVGVAGFAAVAFFQLINLPVEFDASNRAKRLLGELGIVDPEGAGAVRNVLNAAAWTYVAATLQAILMMLYWVLHAFSGSRDD